MSEPHSDPPEIPVATLGLVDLLWMVFHAQRIAAFLELHKHCKTPLEPFSDVLDLLLVQSCSCNSDLVNAASGRGISSNAVKVGAHNTPHSSSHSGFWLATDALNPVQRKMYADIR